MKHDIRNVRQEITLQTDDYQHAAAAAFFTPQRCRIAACTFFLLMLAFGAIPGEAQALSDAHGDKLLHFCAYSLLTCAVFGSLSGAIAGRAWRTIVLIGLLGGLDEGIQSLMSYRYASMTDWAFDMLAASLTVTVLALWVNSRRHIARTPNS